MNLFKKPQILSGIIDSYVEPVLPPDITDIDPRHLPNFDSLLFRPRLLEGLPEQQWGEVTRSMFRIAQAKQYVIRPDWRGRPRQHVHIPDKFAPYLRLADHVAAEVVPMPRSIDGRIPADSADCVGIVRRLLLLNGDQFHVGRWTGRIHMPTADERPFWLPEADIGDDDVDIGPTPFNGPYSRLLQITKNGIDGGVRALMIAPAGAGKTEYFKHLVREVRGRRNLHLVLCLVERPHEVKAIMRQVRLEPDNVHVFAAVDTQSELRRFHTVELAFLRALRLLEKGTPEEPVEVVMLFDGFSNGVEDPINTMAATEGGKLSGSMSRWTASLARILFTTAGRTAGATFTLVATLVDNAADSTQALLNEIIPRANTHISLSGELARKRVFPALDTSVIRYHNQGKESHWPASNARLAHGPHIGAMTRLAELLSIAFWLPAAKTKLVEEDQDRRNEKLKSAWEAEQAELAIKQAAQQAQEALEATQAAEARAAKAEANGGKSARRRQRDIEDGLIAPEPTRSRGDTRPGRDRDQKQEGPPRDGRMIMPDKDPVRERAIQMAGYHLRRLMQMLDRHDSDLYIFKEFDVLDGQVPSLQRLDLLIERGAFNEQGEANLTDSGEIDISASSTTSDAVSAITNNAPLEQEVAEAAIGQTIPMEATIAAPPEADPIATIFDEATRDDPPAAEPAAPHLFIPAVSTDDESARAGDNWETALKQAHQQVDADLEHIFDVWAGQDEVAAAPAAAETAPALTEMDDLSAIVPLLEQPDILSYLVAKEDERAARLADTVPYVPPRPFSWDIRGGNGTMKEVERLLRLRDILMANE